MTMNDAAGAARAAGFEGAALVLAVAIAQGESGCNPNAVGDEDLEDSVWGPSVGLWQVRSLRSHTGTGKERDIEQLKDPAFNGRAAWIISNKGTNFQPWTIYTNGAYRQYMTAAAAAVERGSEMQPWMPGVRQIDRGGSTPVQNDGPTVVVLHTTETDNPANYSGTEPHFEVFDREGGTIQYISLNNTAKALYNAPGGGETNRRRGRIFQIEIVGRAGNAPNFPDSLLRRVADVIRFIKQQFPDLRLVAPPIGFHGAEYGTIAIVNSPLRFTVADWENFGGICGHQHVIENDHWDPGRIDIAKLIRFVGVGQTEQSPEEDKMQARYGFEGRMYMTDFMFRRWIDDGVENDHLNTIGIAMLDWPAAAIKSLHESLVDAGYLNVNEAVARLEVAVRDPKAGIQAQVARLEAAVAAINNRPNTTGGGSIDLKAVAVAVADELYRRGEK